MDPILKLALQTIEQNKQAIVFVPSRASAEKTAEEIAKLTVLQLPELEHEILKAASTPTKQCRKLSHVVKKGVAFHHAGLLQKQKELVEDEFRTGKIKVICCTPTLCLAGNTEIWQPTGSSLVKKFKSFPLFALSQGNKLQVIKAKKVVKNKNSQKLIEISSVSGYFIKVTPNHQMLVKRDNKRKEISASECKKGDKIATVGKLNLDKKTKPKISDFIINNSLPIPDRELTEKDFYFIGSMLGDGHSGIESKKSKLVYKGSPTFTSGDLESIELIEQISKSFDNFSKRRERFGSISLVLSKKKWFREFLCRCGVELGNNKYISPSLIQADLELVASLLQGLFDTDGCVERIRNIAFSNISINLIKDLQRALLRFGIVSRVRKRLGKPLNITGKEYHSKDSYELVIDQTRCITLFHQYVGFGLKRKQKSLEDLILKISHVLYSECKECNYKIYSDIFSGRTKEQIEWGSRKKKVILLLGEKGELASKEIEQLVGFLPRHPNGNRLNHHYEFISKRRIGSRSNTEWFWSLKPIGSWIYWKILHKNKEISDFFILEECPLCKNKLHKKFRKKWRDSDFDGDIFWDYVRDVKEVQVEEEVYDVVLPESPKNDHLFVANGFIVHNSAGLSLPVFRVIIKSLKRYSGKWGMDWIPVLEYLQMAGRAGRPEYEAFGEAVCIAKDETEKEEIHERYILGKPEAIYSKLAVEPVLRTYLLSLVSSGVIRDRDSMTEFFSKTFWAYQFKDLEKLEAIMERMLHLLEEWGFITIVGSVNAGFISANELNQEKLRPTPLGKRVSELYLDPLTARHLLDCMAVFDPNKNAFSLLQMISHTLEMRPLLRIKSKEHDDIQEELTKRYDLLLKEEPEVHSIDYDDFVNSIKTALFFDSWIDEKDEDFLFEKYGICPGEIRVKQENADWLLYAAEELAALQDHKLAVKEIRKLRLRVQHGAKEELLPLLKLQGIGRIRARKLYLQGIHDLGDIKKIDQTSLSQLIGKAVAESLKKQVGEEVQEVPEGKRKGQTSILKY